jgi:hypothetical protein
MSIRNAILIGSFFCLAILGLFGLHIIQVLMEDHRRIEADSVTVMRLAESVAKFCAQQK